MNKLELSNFVRNHLDDGKPATSVFHAFRNCYPEEAVGTKRADFERLVEKIASEREVLLATELGRRYYELTNKRCRFIADTLNWMEQYFDVEALENSDPGTDPNAIDEAVTKIQTLSAMMNELQNSGNRTGEILRELSNDMPAEMQKRAAELFPQHVPLR